MRPVSIQNRHPSVKLPLISAKKIIHTLDAHAEKFMGGIPNGEISIAIVDDQTIGKIHARFLQDPSSTDVITFEGNPLVGSAGDICISADTAFAYARKHGLDPAWELSLYLVHAWLHLAGYDDLSPVKKRRMRAAEKRAMKILEFAKVLPSTQMLRKS